jgi:hypothetical protein
MSAADLAFEPRNAEDYRHQGTTDFDSEELLLVRANLKKSPHLRVAAVAFWEAMGKHEHEDLITETEYRYVHSGLHARCHTLHGRPVGLLTPAHPAPAAVRITKALAPELSAEEREAAAGEDWDDDLGGATQMTLEMYLEGLIEIADQWTAG